MCNQEIKSYDAKIIYTVNNQGTYLKIFRIIIKNVIINNTITHKKIKIQF